MADKILEAYGNQSGVTIFQRTLDAPPAAYDDALKFSNCTDVVVVDCTIRGGREDALDINRGKRLIFQRCRFESRGRYACTVKGGVSDVTFEDCTFTAGTETDVDLGNWSDQAPPPARTREVKLYRCKRADGGLLRIRCLWADKPALKLTPAVVRRVHPVLLLLFRIGKALRLC